MWATGRHCAAHPTAIAERCAAQRTIQHALMQHFKAHSGHNAYKHHYKTQNKHQVRFRLKEEKYKKHNKRYYHFYKISLAFGVVLYHFYSFFLFVHNISQINCRLCYIISQKSAAQFHHHACNCNRQVFAFGGIVMHRHI